MAAGSQGRGEPYRTAARPVLTFADMLGADRGTPGGELLNRAVAVLDRFSAELERAGLRGTTIAPARLALALILDQKARANRALDIRQWSAGALRILFDGREMNADLLADFIRRARGAGAEFDDVRLFLEDCAQRLSGERRHFDRSTGSNWTGIVFVLIAAFVLAVAGWAGYVEWRFHRALTRVFEAEALAVGLDRDGSFPDLAERFARLRTARDQVAAQGAKAPIRLFAGPLGFEASARADATYRQAVNRHLPAAVARAVDEAVAVEGDPVILYDTLRAWSVLSGSSDFAPSYLAGWIAERGGGDPLVSGLAAHVEALAPPFANLPQPDAELFAQARAFAAESGEPERAFLELKRGAGAAELTPWVADERVPGLSDVVERRSGRPIDAPIAGLFTAEGWAYARDFGAGIAVQVARSEAARLFEKPPPTRNDTPDQVMVRLQSETLAVWRDFLTDLRVRPFEEPEAAVFVSGRLSAADTPLVPLLKEVWDQAGGNDRLRDHALQLAIATEFAPMIQYVEQGRMADIASLFAALNVALGAMDRDERTGLQRLMSVQDRANSIATLRQAPTVVVQIVEDVLAQTAEAHADMLTNPITRSWQAEVLPLCKAAVEGRFPFAADGADADPARITQLLAPGGVMDRFFRANVAPYIDTTGPEWRWKPEARFSGLAPESAEFFRTAQGLTAGLFDPGGRLGADLSMAALAEKGKAFVALGGAGGPVETTAESLSLAWPGAEPEKGVEFSFQTPEGSAVLKEAGPWGLLRVLLPLRLRERDEGRRFLVDLRAGPARLFVEITFGAPDNPLARRGQLKGFACPQVL
jgi:type VI protein secretion system component VasK